MTDINGILNIGRTSLMAHQKAIEVTSNNIANVNTPGYTRQRVNFSMIGSQSPISGTMTGSGVTVSDIDRVYDRFLAVQFTNENNQLGRWRARQGGLERIESVFSELSDTGLNRAMTEFWNAWQDLANNPAGVSERALLLNKAENLADIFNSLAEDLQRIGDETGSRIDDELEQINQLGSQIADLNHKIIDAEAVGKTVNTLKDKRELLISELAEKIDINSFENSNGSVSVVMKNGLPLVDGLRVHALNSQENPAPGGNADIVWMDSDGNPTVISDRIYGGALKGWIEIRDEVLPDYLGQLNDLAGEMINAVNGIHRSGFGLDGSQNDFFSGSSAQDISLNDILADTPDKIAAAGPADGLPGGNGSAIAIAGLQQALTMNSNRSTFSEFYDSLVSDVGRGLQNAKARADHQTDMVQHLESYRESVSGVSLDEEMINLMKFQTAYEAAAKLIQTADELLKTVIEMV
jgi:flagellar hook-associated protein 1 FlgK